MKKLTLTYLKKEFDLDGFLKMLKREDRLEKKIGNLDYLILTVCSFGGINWENIIKQLYDVNSDFYLTWDELRQSGELLPKLSNNFKLSYKKVEFRQLEFNKEFYKEFLTCHILKSKIEKIYYLTVHFISKAPSDFLDDDNNWMGHYSILNSFKTLKNAKKSSSIILKKFKTKGIYQSTSLTNE